MELAQREYLEYLVASSFRDLARETSPQFALRAANSILRCPIVAEVIREAEKNGNDDR